MAMYNSYVIYTSIFRVFSEIGLRSMAQSVMGNSKNEFKKHLEKGIRDTSARSFIKSFFSNELWYFINNSFSCKKNIPNNVAIHLFSTYCVLKSLEIAYECHGVDIKLYNFIKNRELAFIENFISIKAITARKTYRQLYPIINKKLLKSVITFFFSEKKYMITGAIYD